MKKFTNDRLEACIGGLKNISEEISSAAAADISEFDPKKTELIIVDVVNGFIRFGAMASPLVESIISPIAELMDICSRKNIPVIAFADCHSENCEEFSAFPPHCIENTPESELVDELKAKGGYTLIKKNSTNGFHENAFKEHISASDKDTFIITGDCTDICVLQLCLALKTYFTQKDLPCSIVVPINCVETYDAPNHNAELMDLAAYKIMKDSGIRFVSEITAK